MSEASRCHVIFCAFCIKSCCWLYIVTRTHTHSNSVCSGITVLCTQTSHFVFRPFPRWCLYAFVHLSLLDAIFVATIFFFAHSVLFELRFYGHTTASAIWQQWKHKFVVVSMACEHFKFPQADVRGSVCSPKVWTGRVYVPLVWKGISIDKDMSARDLRTIEMFGRKKCVFVRNSQMDPIRGTRYTHAHTV